MANFERDGSSRRKPGEGKYSGVSGLTGARICSVRVSGEQFNFLRTAALISDEKKTMGDIIREAVGRYTSEVINSPEFQEEIGRLAILLDRYGRSDSQNHAE